MKNVPIIIISCCDTKRDKLELWIAYMVWILIDQNTHTHILFFYLYDLEIF
jgi:hypothetical protein